MDLPGERGRPLWLVINLDRSPDRLAAIARNLGGLGIPFTRVAAVDGRALALPRPGVDPSLYAAAHGRPPLPGEVGCFLSHLLALRRLLATDSRHAMVLEDDAVVARAAVDLAAALTVPGAPDDWDLVKFEAHHWRRGLAVRRVAPGARLCVLPHRSGGSAAYLVHRRAARALLDGLLPMRFPYDIAFERGWAHGLRVRILSPPPVATAGAPSTIAREASGGARKRTVAQAHNRAMLAAAALGARMGCGRLGWRSAREGEAMSDLADRALAGCEPLSQ